MPECKDDTKKCVSQLALDGVVIVATYALLLWVVDDSVLAWTKALKFYVLYMFLAFVFKYLGVDFQDQLTRVAGIQLGSKLFMAMA